MIKAVCFDMDGVLLDTEHLGTAVLYEAGRLQDCQLTKAQADSLIGANMQSTKDALNRWFPDRIDADRFVEDWCRIMLEHIRRNGPPLKPYAREILCNLRQKGIKLALCTSNMAPVVMEYLAMLGWENAFDQIITGGMIEHGKPAPDIYLLGAEKLGVAPAECIGVEDSINGIRALRAAGMHSVMIPDMLPYTPDLAPYVDTLLTGLQELESLIDKER